MAKRKDLSEMTTQELHRVIDSETAAAAKKAMPHIMRAWEAAVRAGHRGSFDDWLALAMPEHLHTEAMAVADAVPSNTRAAAKFSPWYRKAG